MSLLFAGMLIPSRHLPGPLFYCTITVRFIPGCQVQ